MSAINFVVIGGGAWGTAIAVHLAKMHDDVVLVDGPGGFCAGERRG